jgi:hypothetical protein
MKPHNNAERSRQMRDLHRLDPDAFLRKTFTLPVQEARAKARGSFGISRRRLHDSHRKLVSAVGRKTLFTMRRLPAAD